MEEGKLTGIRVAVLVTDGFEQSELDEPLWELKRCGASVDVLCQKREQLTQGLHGLNHIESAHVVNPDRLLIDVFPEDYDGLLIPGGAISVDTMRTSALHLAFVRHFMANEKPTAVICHGPWLLADAGVIQGYTLTSWPAIRKDLERAGAVWKDAPVLQDRSLITSRGPADLDAFSRAFVQLLKPVAERRKAA